MTTFALFDKGTKARLALRALEDSAIPRERIQLLSGPHRLSHHTMPLGMTAARIGAIVGGVVVGLLAVLAVGTVVWTLTQDGGPIPAPVHTLVLAIGLSTLFGAFAGLLSFSSDNRAGCGRIRGWLRAGREVLLVDDDGPRLDEELRRLGALHVDRVS